MTFAAPLWLLGLIPWSAVVLYLLWGRRPRVDVPFLDLWPAQDEGVKIRRRVAPPPIALALATLSTLLAILATARPGVARSGARSSIPLIIDRGYTIPKNKGSWTLYLPGDTIPPNKGSWTLYWPGARSVVVVPSALGDAIGPTAVDTGDSVRLAVRSALAQTDGPVAVVSNQPLDVTDDRVVQILPEAPVKNARVVTLMARETPAAQVMVRVRGGSGKLRVTTGDQRVERDVQLTGDAEKDEFFDFAKLGPTVRADLLVDDDDLPADNSGWLVRESSWPRIESRVPLPAHLQRMVDVFARQRPPGDASKTLAIVSGIVGDGPSVVIPAEFDVARPQQTPGLPSRGFVSSDHPIARGLTWTELQVSQFSTDVPSNWAPVISLDGKPLVAVREQPVRAVWVGFDTTEWAKSSEFVVFWSNVFNWAGAGGERFASYPVGSLEGDWTPVELSNSPSTPEPKLWPGLYKRADGTLRAIHAPDVPIPKPAETDWRKRLEDLNQKGAGRFDLTPYLALLAVTCLALAGFTWKRRDARVGAAQVREKAAT